MKLKTLLYFFSLIFVLSFCQKKNNESNKNDVYNILDYGAEGDSSKVETEAIQSAIDAAYKDGGGKVIVPAPGKYISGTIWLKDNVTLEVKAGATIYGSDKLSDYDSVRWGHNEDRCPYHLIMAKGAENVTLQGRGTIDGLGWNWYDYVDVKPRWMHKHTPRPSPMVEFDHCKNVKVKDIFLTNAAGWTLHALDSDEIHIEGIRLINNLYGPNNDGIDLSGCRNVMISDCYIKTCDDAVCVKTVSDSRTSSNVTVTNCVMQTTCVALKMGEVAKDIWDITFSNCVITKSSRAFGIYATLGGDVENVLVDNIVCNTNAPLVLNRPFQIAAWKKRFREGKVAEAAGNVRNVTISNFTATTQGRALINANDGSEISNITLKNIKFQYPYIEDPAKYAPKATSSQFRGIDSAGMSANAALVVSNVNKLMLDGLNITWPQQDTIPEKWKHPERIENGKFDKVHKPKYKKVKQTEFYSAFLHNVQGGYIFTPMASSSDKSLNPLNITESNIRRIE